nr:hypothetical protein [uncultured Mediterranean phage uvMED]BAR23549.1 hypothetical protein [uncultured Mediterranean phage uvMED]
MGYQLANGTRLPLDVAWTNPDTGVQHPANWLRLSTERDRELLGITWVAETNQVWDQKFYWGYDSDNNLIPKQLNDEAILDEDGNDTGEVQTGLKTLWKAKQNEIAASLLAPSDWRVVKELEVNSSFSAAKTAYPTEWQTYRAAVRTACNTRQTEIDNCSDVPALKELLFGPSQIVQSDADGHTVLDDNDNPVMIANPNVATAWPDPVS